MEFLIPAAPSSTSALHCASAEDLEMNKIELGAETVELLQPTAAAALMQPRFVIGRGARGGWIVNDRLGLVGGIFVSEAAASHFAFEESGGHKEQIIVSLETAALDLNRCRAA